MKMKRLFIGILLAVSLVNHGKCQTTTDPAPTDIPPATTIAAPAAATTVAGPAVTIAGPAVTTAGPAVATTASGAVATTAASGGSATLPPATVPTLATVTPQTSNNAPFVYNIIPYSPTSYIPSNSYGSYANSLPINTGGYASTSYQPNMGGYFTNYQPNSGYLPNYQPNMGGYGSIYPGYNNVGRPNGFPVVNSPQAFYGGSGVRSPATGQVGYANPVFNRVNYNGGYNPGYPGQVMSRPVGGYMTGTPQVSQVPYMQGGYPAINNPAARPVVINQVVPNPVAYQGVYPVVNNQGVPRPVAYQVGNQGNYPVINSQGVPRPVAYQVGNPGVYPVVINQGVQRPVLYQGGNPGNYPFVNNQVVPIPVSYQGGNQGVPYQRGYPVGFGGGVPGGYQVPPYGSGGFIQGK